MRLEICQHQCKLILLRPLGARVGHAGTIAAGSGGEDAHGPLKHRINLQHVRGMMAIVTGPTEGSAKVHRSSLRK